MSPDDIRQIVREEAEVAVRRTLASLRIEIGPPGGPHKRPWADWVQVYAGDQLVAEAMLPERDD